jgi:hypothetical protein
MHGLRSPELPDAKRNPGCRPARAEKILPQGAETHTPQGIAQEVEARMAKGQIQMTNEGPGFNFPLLVGHWTLVIDSSLVLETSTFPKGV